MLRNRVGAGSYEDTYDQLIENVVNLIRQSRHIQLARIEAWLEGVVLAAEQVQDVRIRIVETPQELSGWKFYGELLWTAFLDTSLAGKLLAKATSIVFTRVLRQHRVFMALPKSAAGEQLKQQALKLARMNSATQLTKLPSGRTGLLEVGRSSPQRTLAAALQLGTGNQAGLQSLGKEEVQLYHASLEALVRGTPDAQKNLTAAAKMATRYATSRGPTPAPSTTGDNTPGVKIRGYAYNLAALTRLGVELRHDQMEALVRSRSVTPNDLALIVDIFGWEELEVNDDNGQRIVCDLNDIRDRVARKYEAVIWADLYGFRRPDSPKRYVNSGEFWNIDEETTKYWLARFGQDVDACNQCKWDPKHGLFAEQKFSEQTRRLQEYFWFVSETVAKYR